MRSLKVRPISFRAQVALVTGIAMVFVTCLASLSIYHIAMNEAIKQLGERLMAVAVSGSLSIDGAAHQKLTEAAQMNSAPYKKIQTQLRELRDLNNSMRLRYVYTMAPTGETGMWRYVV